jgi:hypothetical protein
VRIAGRRAVQLRFVVIQAAYRIAAIVILTGASTPSGGVGSLAGTAPFCSREATYPSWQELPTPVKNHCAGSNPKTATELVVPTNTLPSATVGVMYLLPVPNWSRFPAA